MFSSTIIGVIPLFAVSGAGPTACHRAAIHVLDAFPTIRTVDSLDRPNSAPLPAGRGHPGLAFLPNMEALSRDASPSQKLHISGQNGGSTRRWWAGKDLRRALDVEEELQRLRPAKWSAEGPSWPG